MPDDWELDNELNPADSMDGRAFAGNGYTNLENYLNSIVPTVTGVYHKVADEFSIFPNPAHDIIFFSVNKIIVKIELFDLTGKLISAKINFDQNGCFRIDNLSPGFYLIKTTSQDGHTVMSKILKH